MYTATSQERHVVILCRLPRGVRLLLAQLSGSAAVRKSTHTAAPPRFIQSHERDVLASEH